MSKRAPIPNSVRYTVNWLGPNGVKATNILYTLHTGPVTTVAQLQQAATNMQVALNAGDVGGITDCISDLWTYNGTDAFDYSGATENWAGTGTQFPGTVAGDACPPNCAQTLSWSIPAHYRGGHPRMYLPGVPVSALTTQGSNELSTSWRSKLATWGQAFLTQIAKEVIGSLATSLISAAFERNGVELENPTPYPISGGVVHGRLDSQRRRLGKENIYM